MVLPLNKCSLVLRRLGTDDVEVVRLVAKNRDVNTLSFISFKIGLSANFKDRALSSSTWPRGVYFREFQNLRSNENFWKPQVTPNQTDAIAVNPPINACSSAEDTSMMEQGNRDAH